MRPLRLLSAVVVLACTADPEVAAPVDVGATPADAVAPEVGAGPGSDTGAPGPADGFASAEMGAAGGVDAGAGPALPPPVELFPNCHASFVDPATGRCEPSVAGCRAGERADIAGGCMPVGVPAEACAPEFWTDEGVCVPTDAACRPGYRVGSPAGCVPVEPDCGPAPWGHIMLDPARDIYVDASAPEGGDGSLAHPFESLEAAVPALEGREEARIVVAAGRYPFSLRLLFRQQFVGVCSSQVVLSDDATSIGENGELWGHYLIAVNRASDVLISGVTLEGRSGIGVRESTGVRIDDVIVRDGPSPAVYVTKSSGVSVTRLQSRHVGFVEGDSPAWGAVIADDHGEVEVRDSALIDTRGNGVMSRDASRVVLVNVVVTPGEFDSSVAPGGLEARLGGVVTADSVVVGGHRAVVAQDDESSVDIAHSVVSGRQRALHVEFGGTAESRGNLLQGGDEFGVYVSARTRLESAGDRLTTVPGSRAGEAMFISNEGQARLTGTTVDGPWDRGVTVRDDNDSTSYLWLEGVVVEGTLGPGVVSGALSDTDIDASVVRGTRFAGVQAAGPITRLRLRHSLVVGTQPEPTRMLMGLGLLSVLYAETEIVDSELRDNRVAGVLVADEATLSARGVLIVGTGAGVVEDAHGAEQADAGDGLLAFAGAEASLEAVTLIGNGRAGVLVDGAHATVGQCRAEGNPLIVATQGDGQVELSADAAASCPLEPSETLAIPGDASLVPP